MKVPFKRKAVLRLIVCLLAFVAAMEAWIFLVPQKREVDFMYSQEAFGNPLMGYAPSAWHETVGEDVTLLYMDITWKELEPQEGVFDWESIEEENQLDRWRNQGKRIVLRFVCDLPGEEEHRDIPDWLYEKTGGAGTAYHTSYGYGFSPDYTNPEFLACHLRAVQALGERYGQDGFVAYVELGSLGHWGEWHVRYQDGIQRLPNREIREQYVSHWAYAFPHAKLLMRRPFREGEAYGVGLYNDMAGHRESTEEWLTWIREGGEFSQTQEADGLVPMVESWKSAPVGGEFTSSLEMEEMLGENLEETVSLIRESHTTFLGPKIADSQWEEGYRTVLANMGYRIWISHMELSHPWDGGVQVQLTWENEGVAPMYQDWPVLLQAVDSQGQVVESVPVTIALSQLLPGAPMVTQTTLTSVEWDRIEEYTLRLGVQDPLTGEFSLRFAMEDGQQPQGALVLQQGR